MRKTIFINVAALLCAAALFSGTAVYAASQMEKVELAAESSASLGYDDNFEQTNEPGIAELLADQLLPEVSSGASSAESSSEPASSQPDGSSAAQAAASAAVSSTPPSSAAPPSSATPPSSSEPPPSSSEPVSSIREITLSEMISSEEPLPESSEPVVSENTSGDITVDDPELLDMIAGAVQREIVGVNTAPSAAYYEAYKAQAVASHSYMEYHRRRTGSYPTMSYTTPHPTTVSLVREVMNELMYYNGAVINASYHAAAGGHTQSAEYIWGSSIPYLVGVVSAYDDYERTYTITESDFASKLSAYGLNPTGDPSGWISLASASYTDGGYVQSISVCGSTITGRALREQILGTANLKSPKIVDIIYSGGSFTFTTRGFGHGAGLSQQGALGYARYEGWDYRQILTHYYTGVTIQ